MRKENTIIIGISAVVIVACLLVSWAYVDDGGAGDLSVRSEVSVGDFAEFHVTVSDESPSEFDVRYNYISIDDGVATIEIVYDDGLTEYTVSEVLMEYPDGEVIGTGTVTLDRFGEIECEIHQMPRGEGEDHDTEMWVDPGSGFALATEYIYDDGSTRFYQVRDSSLFDPEPPAYGSQDFSFGLEAGDYSVVLHTLVFSDGLETTGLDWYVLSSVDGDACSYGWASDVPTIGTRAEYISYFYINDYSGYALAGQELIHTPGYGDVICDVLTSEYDGALQKRYVGASDGIVYRQSLEYPSGYSLILDTVFSTHVGDGIDRPVFQERLGDHITIGHYYESEFMYSMTQTIVSVEDGVYTIADTESGATEYRQNDFGLFYDAEGFRYEIVDGTGFMEALDFGTLPYLLTYDKENSDYDRIVHRIYVPLLDIDIGYVYEYSDGTVDYSIILETSIFDEEPEFDSNRVSAEVSEDSRFDYIIETTSPDGETYAVFDSWFVESIGTDGTVTFGWEGLEDRMSGTAGDFLSYAVLDTYPDDDVAGRFVFVDPVYGNVLCDTLRYEYEDGSVCELTVGVEDGVVYSNVYHHADGCTEVQTLLFSTNVGDGLDAPSWELSEGTWFDIYLAMMTEDAQFIDRELRITVVDLVDGNATIEYETEDDALEQITIEGFLDDSYADCEIVAYRTENLLGMGEHRIVMVMTPVEADARYSLEAFYMPYLDLTYGFMLIQDEGAMIYVDVTDSNLFGTEQDSTA